MKKIICLFIIFFLASCGKKEDVIENMIDLSTLNREEILSYATSKKLDLKIIEQYDIKIPKGEFISQSILPNEKLTGKKELTVIFSLGKDPSVYKEYKINELGRIPVMMYHGIENKKNEDTPYTGGNIDKDGYQRTAEAFRADLEFYYKEGYRMIRLTDYVDGIIDVPFGYSPLILTFDDGLSNNIKITGKDEEGNLIIDPNSAIGILESFKKKYPDFQVTATFFINGGLFGQREYNVEILNWLTSHGYDIGNHTYSHANLEKTSISATQNEVGRIYKILEEILPGKYVNIVALPFGTPGSFSNPNFKTILDGTYEGMTYHTKSTLRVGWESDYSPFSSTFNAQYIKRIRAYDNNGVYFDIEYSFKQLQNNRYISDGDKNTITVPKEQEEKVVNKNGLSIVTY